jgi:hypothetical protein
MHIANTSSKFLNLDLTTKASWKNLNEFEILRKICDWWYLAESFLYKLIGIPGIFAFGVTYKLM